MHVRTGKNKHSRCCLSQKQLNKERSLIYVNLQVESKSNNEFQTSSEQKAFSTFLFVLETPFTSICKHLQHLVWSINTDVEYETGCIQDEFRIGAVDGISFIFWTS